MNIQNSPNFFSSFMLKPETGKKPEPVELPNINHERQKKLTRLTVQRLHHRALCWLRGGIKGLWIYCRKVRTASFHSRNQNSFAWGRPAMTLIFEMSVKSWAKSCYTMLRRVHQIITCKFHAFTTVSGNFSRNCSGKSTSWVTNSFVFSSQKIGVHIFECSRRFNGTRW